MQNQYLEIVGRSVAVYVFLIVAIRVFGKKELAQLSVVDLVFILLISNAVQNAMVGQDTSLQGGIVAAFALFASNFILKKVLYRSATINKMIQGDAILLIYKGEMQTLNCQKAEITLSELEAAVREHGVQNIQQVDLAMLEVDGNISIISNDFQKATTTTNPVKRKKLRGRLNKT